MKSIQTQRNHRTENGRTTLCGIRLHDYSDIINKEGLQIPTKYHTFQFEPYETNAPVCEKCDKSFNSK